MRSPPPSARLGRRFGSGRWRRGRGGHRRRIWVRSAWPCPWFDSGSMRQRAGEHLCWPLRIVKLETATPMALGDLHLRWKWRFRSTPEELWPFIADTDRFNRDAGLPPVQKEGAKPPGGRLRMRLTRFGIRVEWDEEPFEWVRPEWFGVRRQYRRGPLRSLHVAVRLRAHPKGGTAITYETWAKARSALWLPAVWFEVAVTQRRNFER